MPEPRSYYISGKSPRDVEQIHQLQAALDQLGYHCAYDWTKHPLAKPFRADEATAIAGRAMLTAASNAELLIILLGPDLIGVYIELGAALGTVRNNGYQKIILIGTEDEVARSVFFFQPPVVRFTSIEGALDYITQLPL